MSAVCPTGKTAALVNGYPEIVVKSCVSAGQDICRTRAGPTYTGEQLQAEIGTFIMAGYETTAHTLSFTMHCIASNPIVQRGIYNEMQEQKLLDKRGDATRNIEYEDLPALKYLSAVLKESMRVLPVVAAFPR